MVRQLLITVPLLALWIMSSFAAAQQLPLAQELAEPPLLSDLATLSGTARQAGDSDGLGSAARLTSPSGLSISADGSFALLVEEGSTKLKRIDIANGQVSTLINTLPGAYSVALSPDASFALIATGRHQTIERVELPSGAISLVAGEAGQSGSANGVSDYAQFNMPTSVAISPDSSFALVADSNNHTIRRIDLASRAVMTLTGRAEYSGTSDGYGADARFQVPTGVAISSDASFALVADSRNATIRRIDLVTNMVTTIAGQAGQYGCTDGIGRAARFEQPSAITISPDNSYALISDPVSHTIRRLDLATGSVVTLVGVNGSSGSVEGVGSTARLDAPRGIDISADGSFALVSDASQHIVSLLSPPPLAAASETVAGVAGQTGSSDGTEAVARFNRPIGVSISDGGLVVIADTDNHTLRQATLITRTISTLAGAAGVAGSTDGSLAAARFNRPLGVSVNRTGLTILVADTGNHTIRLIYPRFGIVRTLAGSAGAPGSTNATGSLARFNTPYAIELSHNNKFALVVDTGNHTIRHITFPGGVVTTLAGMAGSRGSADGFGDRARFNRPVGLSLSRDDSFAIIADEGNGAIRRLNLATGQVTTLIKGLPTSLTGAQVAQFGDRPVLNTVLPCATNTALISNGSEQTISKLDLRTGELQPLLGKPNTPGAVDGIGEEARFNGPSDLTANCDDSDVVVISDTDNQLIRVIDTDTTFRVYAPLLRKYK